MKRDIPDPVVFGGFLLYGNETVEIQARNPNTDRWETIEWAQSSSNSYGYSGGVWYSWYKKVLVPKRYWYLCDGRISQDNSVRSFLFAAEVRSVAKGDALMTFEKGFNSWFDPSESLSDMWHDHGHGSTVTIYARVARK